MNAKQATPQCKRIYFLFLFFPILWQFACGPSEREQASSRPMRPNIIFIFSDDHANRTISAYNGKLNQTPNIDRLADEGAIFLNSFCANSICGPSRASILTGKFSHLNGVVGNASPWNNDQTLFPRLLKNAGYTTTLLGKWHSYKDPETRQYMEMKEKGLLEGKAMKKYAYQQFIKDYLRCVDGLDENVGRLLDWLDSHEEISENTIVVYASDQSYFTGEHGWAEKRFMYEEGMKMPFLIRWPGHIQAGSKMEAMIQNIDYAPTFLDAAGVDIPEEMQGRSFLPLLEGKQPDDWRESVYYHYYDHGLHNVPRHEGVRNHQYGPLEKLSYKV